MHTPELADGYIIGLDWYSIVGGWEKFEEGHQKRPILKPELTIQV
jgi:hypothetical protein